MNDNTVIAFLICRVTVLLAIACIITHSVGPLVTALCVVAGLAML